MTETMSSFQALITGVIAGALVKAGEDFLTIDVNVVVDDDSNYTNTILIRGKESGEHLIVTVGRSP